MATKPPDIADAMRRDGAAVWRGFLHPEVTAEVAVSANNLANGEHGNHYPKSTRVWDLHRHGDSFLNILEDQRLHALLDLLLGEHHLLSDYSLNVVHPHQPVDSWHIDYPYNEMPHLVTGAILGLQCVLALDRFDPRNGATQYIPGTHLLARPPRDTDQRSRNTFTRRARRPARHGRRHLAPLRPEPRHRSPQRCPAQLRRTLDPADDRATRAGTMGTNTATTPAFRRGTST